MIIHTEKNYVKIPPFVYKTTLKILYVNLKQTKTSSLGARAFKAQIVEVVLVNLVEVVLVVVVVVDA